MCWITLNKPKLKSGFSQFIGTLNVKPGRRKSIFLSSHLICVDIVTMPSLCVNATDKLHWFSAQYYSEAALWVEWEASILESFAVGVSFKCCCFWTALCVSVISYRSLLLDKLKDSLFTPSETLLALFGWGEKITQKKTKLIYPIQSIKFWI